MPTVLVIDDDKDVRNYFRTVLISRGHKVLEAGNQTCAVRLFRHDRPDVVFCDRHLSHEDGLDTIAELRRLCADTPIVLISGGDCGIAMSEDHDPVLGPTHVAMKPISPVKMLRIVSDNLRQLV